MKKPSKKDFYSPTLFLRNWSAIVAHLLNIIRITPNQITLARFFIFIFPAGYLFFKGSYLDSFLGLMLLFVNFFFDLVDGDLARNYDKKTSLGKFLDSNLDFVTLNIILLSITLNIARTGGIFLYFAIFLLFLIPLSLKLTNIFEMKFNIDCVSGNEKFHTYFSKLKPDTCSLFLRELIYPISFISYTLTTFRTYLLIGVIFGILPLTTALYGIAILIRVILLFSLFILYFSNNSYREKIKLIKALEVIDKEKDRYKT